MVVNGFCFGAEMVRARPVIVGLLVLAVLAVAVRVFL